MTIQLKQYADYHASSGYKGLEFGSGETQAANRGHTNSEEVLIMEECLISPDEPGAAQQPVESFETSDNFTVPAIPPSLLTCAIIQLRYALSVDIQTSGLTHNKMELQVPVVIGSIPLVRSDADQLAIVLSREVSPKVLGLPKELADTPPSSYEEYIFGKTTIVDDEDEDLFDDEYLQWIPSYPMFQFVNFTDAIEL